MLSVFKYPLTPGFNTLQLPVGSKILHIHHQTLELDSHLMLWALVNPKVPIEDREFYVAMTGEDIEVREGCLLEYIGTAHMFGGKLVVHAFEITEFFHTV